MGREKQEEQLQMGMFNTAEAVQTEAPETDAVLPRMKELVATLDEAARAYYAEGREIMSNFEYDALYDELAALESQTGVILAGSPTQRVGYEVMTELPKERHESRMLSLDKTKSVEDLADLTFAVCTNFRAARPTVTNVGHVSYLNPPAGDTLYSESRMIKDGNRICFYEIRIWDNAGVEVATVSMNGYHI